MALIVLIGGVAVGLVAQIAGYFRSEQRPALKYLMFVCWAISAACVIGAAILSRQESAHALNDLWGRSIGLMQGGGL